jgi:hypothetical protein
MASFTAYKDRTGRIAALVLLDFAIAYSPSSEVKYSIARDVMDMRPAGSVQIPDAVHDLLKDIYFEARDDQSEPYAAESLKRFSREAARVFDKKLERLEEERENAA